ncbi:MAG: hypothetical protein KIT87_05910 [Anaerolineae bacterium]|nr:hypothetical protein [Anaerolineae bacterium]
MTPSLVMLLIGLALAACANRAPSQPAAVPTTLPAPTAAAKAPVRAEAPNAAPTPAPTPVAKTGATAAPKAAAQPSPTPLPPALRPSAEGTVALFVLPDDGYAPVVNAIKAAQKSIRLVIYLLLDDDVVDALIAAKRRGVEVRVMVEPDPAGGGGSQDDVAKLKAAGVQTRDSDPTFRYTHQKTLIIDERTALIMTLNLTRSSFTRNREYGIIDTDPAHVSEIVRVFDADWQREKPRVSQPDLVWSPDNARERLLQFLRSAQAAVDIQIEGFSDNEFEDTLAALARRGVRVRLLLPTLDDGDSRLHELDWIVGRGVKLRRLDQPFQHTKMVLVDGKRAWVGSQNFSSNALENNRELGIFLTDTGILRRLSETFERDWNRGD